MSAWQNELQIQWSDLLAKYPEAWAKWGIAEQANAKRAAMQSHFIYRAWLFDETLIDWLHAHGEDRQHINVYADPLSDEILLSLSEVDVMKRLRQYRRQEMLFIAWKDAQQSWSIEDSLTHLSVLAEALILAAYRWSYHQACQSWGTPLNADGQPMPMWILGMGKLGGGELNFSSDIDLIFSFESNGETQGARRSLSHSEFFTRVGQRVIKLLDSVTVDGFCYRVDMRLRPFGESGPLVMSLNALESYYQEQGRDWERYAMIKAKVLGYEDQRQSPLWSLLRPFVFRRYLDFSAIQALRRMKALICSEVRRRHLVNNIKLGAGGIREIEFVVQTFQLIRGGREPSLQGRGLIHTLQAIESMGLLDSEAVTTLSNHYRFFRQLENYMQAIDDKQTQTLPDDPLDQARLVSAMFAENWASLFLQIQTRMAEVHEIFLSVIGEESAASDSHENALGHEVWNAAHDPILLQKILSQSEIVSSDAFSLAIAYLKQELSFRTIGERGRVILQDLIPNVLERVFSIPLGDQTLTRITPIFLSIASRTTYLELLNVHGGALAQLIYLCQTSPRIAKQLAQYPLLLDELLDPEQLYSTASLTDYQPQLQSYLMRIPEDDLEQQMEAIRQFKQMHLLRIAAADQVGSLALTLVSDHLTALAEAIVSAVVAQAWRDMVSKFGLPSHLSGRDGAGLAVIAYGKLGGWELSYSSDLDLVFLHDCPIDSVTLGDRHLDSRQFYLRLTQRVMHLFSTRTLNGVLYDVDIRLRPSGASGLLISPMDSFDAYQQEQAWTWEHQALVRARLIYGDLLLTEQFNGIRNRILMQDRDSMALAADIVAMREKMRKHKDESTAEWFDLKQGIGGITDIEFLVQFWVLSFAHRCPELLIWSDNLRILDTLAKMGWVSDSTTEMLSSSYCQLRNSIHRRYLQEESALISTEDWSLIRHDISETWQRHLILPFKDLKAPC
jgi:glutamate-ammonia-ligase adenylyltransferase